MEKFEVSVIIPVYNAEKYVARAIHSALKIENVSEVIVVEDNSPDKSLDVCLSIAVNHTRLKVLQHTDHQNHGAGASRNLGILNAKSKYIAFLDADDYYLPDRFDKDKELFENCLNIEGVYNALGTEYYEDVKSGFVERDYLTTISSEITPSDLFQSLLSGKYGWIHLDTLTVKKSVVEKVGQFNHMLKLTQDTHFILRLAAKGMLVGGQLAKAVAVRGIHSENRISNSEELLKYRKILFDDLLDWSIVNNLTSNLKMQLWQFRFDNILYIRKLGKLDRCKILVEEAIKYPFVLKYTQFYSKIPGLKFIFNKHGLNNNSDL